MRGRIRGWWPVAAVTPFLVAAFWLLYVVWHSSPQRRTDLATYGAFAVPVATLMAAWIAWAWRARKDPADPTTAGKDFDHVTDLLAMTVKTQWERAAGERGLLAEPIPVTWGRPAFPLAGPATAAMASRRFSPLPGLTPIREAQLAAGQIDDLHAVYGGLRSGRLVIAGPPGSGKSSAAVLLVLAALRHRDRLPAEDRAKIPVPVLFTVQDWDPRREPIREWLAGQLQQTYPLFAGRTGAANASGLIDAGKLTLILDGLDEIARKLRPVALQALDQASFRVVVLSRTAEMALAASQRGVLQGAAAIELRDIDPATAAGYLERVQLDPPPPGWHDLINRIRAAPASPLTKALNNPLALTLIRDTYQSGDDARELLDHCDTIQQPVTEAQAVKKITGYLLDRVLPVAYASRPGKPPPRYDLQTAQNALTKIAVRMNQDGTRNLQWWHIPRWTSPMVRVIAGGIVAWLLAGLIFGLVGLVFGLVGIAFELVAGLTDGLWNAAVTAFVAWLNFGLVVGLVVGLIAGVAARGTAGSPARMGRIRRPRLRRVFNRKSLEFGLVVGLMVGLVAGVGFGLAFGLVAGLSSLLGYGLAFGLVAGLAMGLASAFVDLDSSRSPSPVTSWRDDRRHAVAIGLVVGLVVAVVLGLVAGLVAGVVSGLAAGVGVGVEVGVGAGLVSGFIAGFGTSCAWPTTLAAAQLAMQWHTPLRLINFLDDARERNLLRTVGPVYQFRHASLQDHLAIAAANGRNNSHTDQL